MCVRVCVYVCMYVRVCEGCACVRVCACRGGVCRDACFLERGLRCENWGCVGLGRIDFRVYGGLGQLKLIFTNFGFHVLFSPPSVFLGTPNQLHGDFREWKTGRRGCAVVGWPMLPAEGRS